MCKYSLCTFYPFQSKRFVILLIRNTVADIRVPCELIIGCQIDDTFINIIRKMQVLGYAATNNPPEICLSASGY